MRCVYVARRSQWLVVRFGLWSSELSLVDRLLNEDVRNNSAWSYRFFLLSHQRRTAEADVIRAELSSTFRRLSAAPHNESPWNFLVGLSSEPGCGLAELQAVEQRTAELLQRHPQCHFALSALVDVWEHPLLKGDEQRRRQAQAVCAQLAEQLDPVRRSYWRMREQQLVGHTAAQRHTTSSHAHTATQQPAQSPAVSSAHE